MVKNIILKLRHRNICNFFFLPSLAIQPVKERQFLKTNLYKIAMRNANSSFFLYRQRQSGKQIPVWLCESRYLCDLAWPLPGGWWELGGSGSLPPMSLSRGCKHSIFTLRRGVRVTEGKEPRGRKEGRKEGEGVFPSNERTHGVIDRCPRPRLAASWSGSYPAFHPNLRGCTNGSSLSHLQPALPCPEFPP